MAGNDRRFLINREITSSSVRLVDAKGGQMGVVSLEDALKAAEEVRLDLVMVSGDANPPVCRLMDFGKFKYERQKHEAAARKHIHKIVTKEVKLRVKIAPHDYQVKLRAAERFLVKGDKVKALLTFRGREREHNDLGRKVLGQLVVDLADYGTVETRVDSEEAFLAVTLTPKPNLAKMMKARESAREGKGKEGVK
jgi:translation initiation factor IF-3